MYTPDRSIVKQLKECDPDLDVRWDRGLERWIITCMGRDSITVSEPNGDYRPLDGRAVTMMREKAWEYRTFFGALHIRDREVHKRNWQRAQARKAAARDDFRQYAIEDIYPRVTGVGGAFGRNKFSGWSPAP